MEDFRRLPFPAPDRRRGRRAAPPPPARRAASAPAAAAVAAFVVGFVLYVILAGIGLQSRTLELPAEKAA